MSRRPGSSGLPGPQCLARLKPRPGPWEPRSGSGRVPPFPASRYAGCAAGATPAPTVGAALSFGGEELKESWKDGACNSAPLAALPAPPPPPFPPKATGAGGTSSSLDCGAAPRTRRTRSLPRRPLRASFWKTEGKEEKVVTACGSCYARNGICDGEKPVLDIRAPAPSALPHTPLCPGCGDRNVILYFGVFDGICRASHPPHSSPAWTLQ